MKTFSALIALALAALEHRNKRRALRRGSAQNKIVAPYEGRRWCDATERELIGDITNRPRQGAMMKTAILLAAAAALVVGHPAQAAPMESTSATTTYHRMTVGGVSVFYREAGPKDAPTIVLLHG